MNGLKPTGFTVDFTYPTTSPPDLPQVATDVFAAWKLSKRLRDRSAGGAALRARRAASAEDDRRVRLGRRAVGGAGPIGAHA